jgi:hypothetical protein
MNTKSLEEIQNNEVVRKRLAKAMARDCFRNTKLEDFHAGTFPSSKAGDYSDVKVVSPYGEIGWERLSRLSDEEMKALMIDVVNHCYDFLTTLCGPFGDTIVEHSSSATSSPSGTILRARYLEPLPAPALSTSVIEIIGGTRALDPLIKRLTLSL